MATFVFPAQARSSGTLWVPSTSGAVVASPATCKWAQIAFMMPTLAERASTTARFDWAIEVSGDSGATWTVQSAAGGWRGGQGLTQKNSTVQHPPPFHATGIGWMRQRSTQAWRVRMRVTSATALTWGATVTVE